MSPTLRVDEGVYRWLKSQAEPFEDTPNSVLRRLAGLGGPSSVPDGTERQEPERSERRPRSALGRRVTGESLRKQHSLPVRHALYHKDGTFFERLTEFPGALCDPNGWVQFKTHSDFTNDKRLSIGRKVNVHRGIASHPNYRRFPAS